MPPVDPIRVDDFTDPRPWVLRPKKRSWRITRMPFNTVTWLASLNWQPVELKRLVVRSETTGVTAPGSHSRAHPVISPDDQRFHFAPGRELLRARWEIVGAPIVTRIRFELFSNRHAHDDGQSRLLWQRTLDWQPGDCPPTGHIALKGAFDQAVDPEEEDLGPVVNDDPWLDEAAFDPHGPPGVLTSGLSPYKLKLTIEDPGGTLYRVKPARWAYLEVRAKDGPTTPFSDAPCRRIHAIHIGRSQPTEPSTAYHDELKIVAATHGFRVVAGWNRPADSGSEWLRDTQIVRDSGGFLLPRTVEDIHEETGAKKHLMNYDLEDRTQKFASLRPGSYVGHEDHPDFTKVPYRVASSNATAAESHATRQRWDAHRGDSVVEGGNILVTTRPDGERGALVGELSVLQTMVTLQWRGQIGPLDGEEFDPERELKALGDGAYGEALAEALSAARQAIADDLQLDVEDVVFVEQLAFHLDMCMAVGPNDQILVQDHAASLALLAELEAETWEPDEEELRKRYRDHAKELAESMSGPTEQVTQQLENAGYDVVRVAAVFTGGKDAPPINFLNHIAGTNDAGEMFYLTNAAAGRLGAAIQERFAAVLYDLGYASVHFLGVDGKAAESLWRSGGLRCLTAVQPYPYRRSDE